VTAPGLILAAPASGGGKTTVTIALARAYRQRGLRIATAKTGPDYIDPSFHAAATGLPCLNLDPWAMRPDTLASLAAQLGAAADLVLCEGVMGLFDGIDAGGTGSTADLAAITGWPVVLVVNAGGMSASAAALVHGLVHPPAALARESLRVAGVIFNRVGGTSHVQLLRDALARAVPAVPVIGAVPRNAGLSLPERHLGLVPAGERPGLEAFLDGAAAAAAGNIDLERLRAIAAPARLPPKSHGRPLPPLGQRIAVARDDAFGFAYPAVLDGWRESGAELSFFSPLAGEAPASDSDAVYLPGGYPELHAGRLASAARFLAGLRKAASRDAVIYGECGGYMTLGDGLVDADGCRHAMAGLLPVETSFAERRLHLGYRQISVRDSGPLGPAGTSYRGHEFHYATVMNEGGGVPLFAVADAAGRQLPAAGRRVGTVCGSFMHLIDEAIV
jgi:cobyrinic acid a,c-diamide synthase